MVRGHRGEQGLGQGICTTSTPSHYSSAGWSTRAASSTESFILCGQLVHKPFTNSRDYVHNKRPYILAKNFLLPVPAHCSHCCANMIDCSMPSPALCSTQSCTLRAIHGCLACCCYCWAKRASQIRWDGRLATAHVLQPSASPGPFHGTQDISSDVRLRRQSIRRS